MEQCLIDNEICSTQHKRCKICKLDDCRKALIMLEEEEAMWVKTKEERLIEDLEKNYPMCKKCTFLKIIDVNKKIVYCPYMIKGCIIKGSDSNGK